MTEVPDYRYSYDEEFYNYSDEREAVDALLSRSRYADIKVGDEVTIYRGVPRKYNARDFVNSHAVDTFLEGVGECAYDNCGESAEDFAYCSQDAQDELHKLMQDWVEKHLVCHFYGISDVEEIKVTITQEMLD